MCKKLILNKITTFFLAVLTLTTSVYARDYSCIDPSRINRKALPVVPFKTPDLSDENILEVVYDVRPIRLSGVRIEPERFKEKLIVHNYGYGGYGLSLCFGGSSEVLNILNHEMSRDSNFTKGEVAVLGAGIVGLATAYDLVQKGFKVSIYADQFYPNITSYIAAGIWTTPFQRELKTPEITRRYQKMIATSEKRYFQSVGDNPEFKRMQ